MTGIDAITIYIPPYRVDAEKLAQKRGVEPQKILKGLGMREISISAPNQDTTALGLNAVEKLFREFRYLNPSRIREVAVATETPTDLSDGIGTHIVEKFDIIPENVGVKEIKQACVSGLAEACSSAEDYKLLVTTDKAVYPLGSGAEFTQGAGAVALLIGDGDILSVEGKAGRFTLNVPDFFKPIFENDKLEAEKTPKVYGNLSKIAYTFVTTMAVRDFMKRNNLRLKDIDLVVYHIPYPNLPKYAIKAVAMAEEESEKFMEFEKLSREAIDRFKKFQKEGKGEEELMELDRKEMREYWCRIKEMINGRYEEAEKKVEPSLKLSPFVGNIYTGSVFLGLISALKFGNYREGSRILTVGYGSGASSVAISWKTNGKTRELVKRIEIEDILKPERKRYLEIAEYERWHGKTIPGKINGVNGFYLERVARDGFRFYRK